MHIGLPSFVTTLLLILLQGDVRTASRDLPFTSRLQRGINLNGWFTGTRIESNRFSQKDLQSIAALGFTFVRLPIDPERLMARGVLSEDSLVALDHAVDLITSSGLAVIADIHPTQNFERHILSDNDSLNGFVRFLEAFCSHVRRWSRGDLGVELLNEPFDPRAGRRVWDWNAIQRELWTAARRALPDHTLILTGDAWSSMSGLRTVVPILDPNVLYTIHFYQPYPFTHQGANWMQSDPLHFAELHGVPYPADSERVRTALESVVRSVSRSELRDSIRSELGEYARAGWNRQKLAQSFSQTAEWASQHHEQLVLGEFGAYKRGPDPADRCRWLQDVRELAELNRFSWAMWEYDGGFGLLNQDGSPDKCVVSALGLRPTEAR
jgi:aryl-phospho-beta-D-glucosidase BglC (GH1 family)